MFKREGRRYERAALLMMSLAFRERLKLLYFSDTTPGICLKVPTDILGEESEKIARPTRRQLLPRHFIAI